MTDAEIVQREVVRRLLLVEVRREVARSAKAMKLASEDMSMLSITIAAAEIRADEALRLMRTLKESEPGVTRYLLGSTELHAYESRLASAMDQLHAALTTELDGTPLCP